MTRLLESAITDLPKVDDIAMEVTDPATSQPTNKIKRHLSGLIGFKKSATPKDTTEQENNKEKGGS